MSELEREITNLALKVEELNRRIAVLQIAMNDLIKSISEYVNEVNKEISRLRNESKKTIRTKSQKN